MGDIKAIYGDLEALLESSKVKRIVISESKAEPILEASDFAQELTTAVFGNTPKGSDPALVGKCILQAAKVQAEELGISEKALVEAVFNYCLTVAESLSDELNEDISFKS